MTAPVIDDTRRAEIRALVEQRLATFQASDDLIDQIVELLLRRDETTMDQVARLLEGTRKQTSKRGLA